jgi:hypothetical protein
MKDSKPNDKSMSTSDLGVTFRDKITETPEQLGLSNSGPNQTPDGPMKMSGNRKGTGSSKI